MINPNTARMLDQKAYDRAVAAQKVHDRNAALEDENATLRARVAELTGRVEGLEEALRRIAELPRGAKPGHEILTPHDIARAALGEEEAR